MNLQIKEIEFRDISNELEQEVFYAKEKLDLPFRENCLKEDIIKIDETLLNVFEECNCVLLAELTKNALECNYTLLLFKHKKSIVRNTQ